jgi:hypothetical protein
VARSTLAKVTRRLLPFLFVLYVVCFLDRVNLGFAALQMNQDLGFSPAGASGGARKWLARIADPAYCAPLPDPADAH